MRRFQNEQFPSRLADALSSIHLEIPNQDAQEALDYVKQYVQRSSGNARLHRGYIPEGYINSLITIRDASGKRDFSSAVEQLGVDGATSEEVTQYSNFELLEIESDRDLLQELNDVYYQVVSDEARTNVRTLQDLIRNVSSGNKIRMYLPQESYDQITNNLTSNVI